MMGPQSGRGPAQPSASRIGSALLVVAERLDVCTVLRTPGYPLVLDEFAKPDDGDLVTVVVPSPQWPPNATALPGPLLAEVRAHSVPSLGAEWARDAYDVTADRDGVQLAA